VADGPTHKETEWLADAAVSATGGMNLPKEARKHLGLDGASTVLVFGQRGRVILTPVGLADDLLEFAAARAAERKATADTDTSGKPSGGAEDAAVDS
jgi:bifunctional DNA-binding transcriptional regulator/antitoxin component of YhaV-PrlF toxin-antitoxin module